MIKHAKASFKTVRKEEGVIWRQSSGRNSLVYSYKTTEAWNATSNNWEGQEMSSIASARRPQGYNKRLRSYCSWNQLPLQTTLRTDLKH